MHVATCSSFAINLASNSPHPSTCLKGHPTSDPENEDDMIELDDMIEKVASSKLDPRGYRQVCKKVDQEFEIRIFVKNGIYVSRSLYA